MKIKEQQKRQQRHLVVIRISDSAAMRELEKLTKGTAAMHPDLPGAERMGELGVSPLLDPEQVGATTYTLPGLRAAVYRIPGEQTWVLLVLGSASKVTPGDDDNEFVKLLSSVLKERKFHTLWVADFARLLRAVEHLSATWVAVRAGCRFIRHGGASIDTHGPSAEIQFLFEALTAAADARSVVKRTLNGKMRRYVNGQCPLPPQGVPLGYRKNPDGYLERDERMDPSVVQTIVRVLGDPSLTDQDRVERVVAHARDVAANGGDGELADQLAASGQPNSATVQRWYRTLDVWQRGQWKVTYEIPDLLRTHDFELPVDIKERDDERSWLMTFDLDSPPDGWASKEEFAAARELGDTRQRRRASRGGNSPGTTRKPFCGLPAWESDGWQYALLSHQAGSYELRRRPADRASTTRTVDGVQRRVERGWGRRPHLEGDRLAVLSASHLHAALAEGLAGAASEGMTAQSSSYAALGADHGLDADLRDQVEAQQRVVDNSRRNANEALDELERREWLHDAQRAREELAQLEQDLLRFVGTTNAGEVAVDADSAALALASVADVNDTVPGSVADALRDIITDFELHPVDDTNLRWQASLRLPMAGGALTIGPTTGMMEIGLPRHLTTRHNRGLIHRGDEAAKLFMGQGLDLDAVAHSLGVTPQRRIEQVIRDHLKGPLGLNEQAVVWLVGLGAPTARRVVWARKAGRPYPSDLPLAYAKHIERTYLQRPVPGRSLRHTRLKNVTTVLDTVAQHGGWIAKDEISDFLTEAGIAETSLTYYLQGRLSRSAAGGRVPPILSNPDGGISFIPCPHQDCDGWANLLVIYPEVDTDLLCPTCMRMPRPDASDIRFPTDYQALADHTGA